MIKECPQLVTVAIGGIKDRAKSLCKWAQVVQHAFTSILPSGLSLAYETVVLGAVWITSLEFHIKKPGLQMASEVNFIKQLEKT